MKATFKAQPIGQRGNPLTNKLGAVSRSDISRFGSLQLVPSVGILLIVTCPTMEGPHVGEGSVGGDHPRALSRGRMRLKREHRKEQ